MCINVHQITTSKGHLPLDNFVAATLETSHEFDYDSEIHEKSSNVAAKKLPIVLNSLLTTPMCAVSFQ